MRSALALLLLAGMTHAADARVSPPWPCEQPIPLTTTAETCVADGPEINAYVDRCVAPGFRGALSPTALALKYTALLKAFDREADLISRLRPVVANAAAWSEMESRWSARLDRNPELVAFDESEDVKSDLRGGLELRVHSIAKLRAHALESEAAFNRGLNVQEAPDTSRYLLAASLLNETLDLNSMKAVAPTTRVLDQQRDAYFALYPELEADWAGQSAHVFMALTHQTVESLSHKINFAPLVDNVPNGPTVRFRHMLEHIDQVFQNEDRDTRRVRAWLARNFEVESARVIEILERSLDELDRKPIVATEQKVLLGSTGAVLSPSAARVRDGVWALNCKAYNEEKRWATLAHVTETYLVPASYIALAGLGLGGGLVFASERALGFVGEQLLLRGLLGSASRLGAKSMAASNIVMLAAGIPLSTFSLIEVFRGQAYATRDFYLSGLGASAETRRLERASEERWVLFMNLMPVAYAGIHYGLRVP